MARHNEICLRVQYLVYENGNDYSHIEKIIKDEIEKFRLSLCKYHTTRMQVTTKEPLGKNELLE